MKKIIIRSLVLCMTLCLSACSSDSKSENNNEVKDKSLKIGETYYEIEDRGDGNWDVYYSAEVINPNSKDANNYQGLFIDCQDEDGYSIEESGQRTGYILAKDHTYISWYITSLEEKPEKVVFSIEDIADPGELEEPIAEGKKSNDLFKLKDVGINDVENYGSSAIGNTHKEVTGSICSDMESYPNGVNEVEVISVFYKDKKLVGSESKTLSDLNYKEKRPFNISSFHMDLDVETTYDDYKIVIALPSNLISDDDAD